MICLLQIKKMKHKKLIQILQSKDDQKCYLSFQFVSSKSLYTFYHAFCSILHSCSTRLAVKCTVYARMIVVVFSFYMSTESVVVNDSVGKMLKSVWKDGQSKNQIRRNSPRLSALNASKEAQQKKTINTSKGAFEKEECHGEKQGQPSRTRTGVKRKFSNLTAKHVSEVGFNRKKWQFDVHCSSVPNKFVSFSYGSVSLDLFLCFYLWLAG